MWGGGYSEVGRAVYPALPLEPIQNLAKCAKCGRRIPPDEYAVVDGLTFHDRCLSAKFLHPEQEP